MFSQTKLMNYLMKFPTEKYLYNQQRKISPYITSGLKASIKEKKRKKKGWKDLRSSGHCHTGKNIRFIEINELVY